MTVSHRDATSPFLTLPQFGGGDVASRRRFLRTALLIGAAATLTAPLAGCGFRPLYGNASTVSTSSGSRVDQQMAGIHIDAIANREGQQLHNALRDRFNPLGQPASSAYTLSVNLSIRTYGALSKRDLSATRRNVEFYASYSLRDNADKVVMTDRSTITTGYDEFDDPLNDISAYEDTIRRATLQLAEQIRTRVAVFMTSGTPTPITPPPPGTPPPPEPPGSWSEP
jgi:LPS-assembly lipoprotein